MRGIAGVKISQYELSSVLNSECEKFLPNEFFSYLVVRLEFLKSGMFSTQGVNCGVPRKVINKCEEVMSTT